MEEENNPLWPWVLGFVAYRSYRNRKKNKFYTENFYDDEMFDDYFEEETNWWWLSAIFAFEVLFAVVTTGACNVFGK